jgi:catechol 2,3-dioxygenase-like lactoylglutathione lyase family enzyme
VLRSSGNCLCAIGDWNEATLFSFTGGVWEVMQMEIQGMYAALATASMEKAERFYTLLFGREPDDRPMDGLIQWRNVAGANIQIFHNKENAGSGRITIVVPEMGRARRSLEGMGVELADESTGDYGKIAQLTDPDGNLITLAEPPSRPFS